ncbi:hypothetical protein NLJ89_g4080 [Agrocybe chaxingu]|uniref:pectate lyase n=1 Tax=Agrocybe chaxingu TaxID=84603 RepID=A0A9W8K3J1_9AGAR|nr:hypothetical protein NLJ89_g4080 [Agrocybe chaxingu]
MQWFLSFFSFAVAFQVVFAAPAGLERRASATDAADVGFATLNGGTTGGVGGTTTTVSTLAALTAAVKGTSKKIVIVSGKHPLRTITGNAVVSVGSNTSVLGKKGSSLVGVGLRVKDASNVIVRNIRVSKVLASTGDAIAVQKSSRVWLDHLDLSSDRDHDKDFYDGLLDITHGSTGVTVSWSKLHDHFKASLVGHSDNNKAEDTKITVTYANNHFVNLNSRLPSFRFGRGHIFNNLFQNSNDGINTRLGAQLLVENNVFARTKKPIFSTDGGFAVARGNDLGGATNTAPNGSFTSAPYSYTLSSVAQVKSAVAAGAGQTLSF